MNVAPPIGRRAGIRATWRAVGQVYLLFQVSVSFNVLLTIPTTCATPGEACGWNLVGPNQISRAVELVLASVGFWATCSHRRRPAAVGCAWALVACEVGWAVYATSGYESISAGSVVTSLTWLLLVAGPVVLLLLSYRSGAPELDEPSPAGWVLLILTPLAAFGASLFYMPVVPVWSPLSKDTVALLVGGALYGLLRRARPLPGAASWIPTTLVLAALALPDATLTHWRFGDEATIEPTSHHSWGPTTAWLAEVAVVAVLAAAQWAALRSVRAAGEDPCEPVLLARRSDPHDNARPV